MTRETVQVKNNSDVELGEFDAGNKNLLGNLFRNYGRDFLLCDDNFNNDKKVEEFFRNNFRGVCVSDAKIIIDELIARARVSMFGKENEVEGYDENLEFDEVKKIGERFLTGLMMYGRNQEVINKIIQIYPYYTLGDNQPLIFTDLLKDCLKKYGKNFDKSVLIKMIIDLHANKMVNTKTFEMHEDDFWEFNQIVFGDCGASINEYLQESQESEKTDIEVLKTMKFICDVAKDKIEQGAHWDEVGDIYQYLKKQLSNESYVVSEKARVYLDLVDIMIDSVEMNAITFVLWNHDYENRNNDLETLREIYSEDANNWNHYKIAEKLKNLEMSDRCKYYKKLVKSPTSINTSEIWTLMSRKRMYTKSVALNGGILQTQMSKDSVGAYGGLGDLLYSQTRKNGSHNEKTNFCKNEDLLNDFYSRQGGDDSHVLDFDKIDENYLFFEFSNIYFRRQIEKNFKIKMEDYNLYEQKQFFYFILNKSKSEIEEVKNFLYRRENDDKRKYQFDDGTFTYGYYVNKKKFDSLNEISKNNRFKSFLSLEQGQEMSAKLLLIDKKLEPDDADKIFARYVEIVDLTENIRQEIKNSFNNDKEVDDEEVDKIARQVLTKANCLLVDFANRLEAGEKMDENEVLATLEEYKANILLSFSAFKHLRGKVGIEDLRGVSFEKIPTGNLSRLREEIIKLGNGENVETEESDELLQTIEQMFRLYGRNYGRREEFKKVLLKGFADALIDGSRNIQLNVIKKDGKVVAFNRVEEKENGKKYFSSCNVLPAAQVLSIGGELFNITVQEYFIDSEVNATCDAFTSTSPASMYIERGQFAVEKIDTESDPDGIPWFAIKREREGKSYYQGESNDDLVKECQNQGNDLSRLLNAPHFILSFDDNGGEMKDTAIDLVNNQGYKITRYFKDKKTKKIFLAFEKHISPRPAGEG